MFKRARQAQLHLHQSADIRRRTQWNEVILGRKCSGRTAARVKCAPTPAVASSRRSWRASTFASLLRRLCEQNNSAALRGGGIMLLQERLHRRWPLSVTFTELALLGHRRLAAVLGIARRPRQLGPRSNVPTLRSAYFLLASSPLPPARRQGHSSAAVPPSSVIWGGIDGRTHCCAQSRQLRRKRRCRHAARQPPT